MPRYPVAVGVSGETAESVDLRAYLAALWRRRMVVLLCLLIVVLSAAALSYRKESLYRASAQVLLQPRLREVVVNSQTNGYVDPIRSQKTEIQIITSPAVKASVEERLGYAGKISVRPLPDTDIVFIEAVDADPARAAGVANAYVDAYIAFRHRQAVEDLTAAGAEVQNKISDLQRQIDVLKAASPPPAPATATTPVSTPNPQLDALVNQQILLKQKLDQIQVDANLSSGGAQVVAAATAPDEPFTPDHQRDIALALAVGLLFGIGVALLWEFIDDSIESDESLHRALPGVPTLALIPGIKNWKNPSRPLVVSISDQESPAAEAYRSLRTSVNFARLERNVSVIQVTSPTSSEDRKSVV
jgi:uncharacterized protein involved in exopolysaccharide biosynthesis